MTPETSEAPLITDDQVLARAAQLIRRAARRQLWLVFLDELQRQCPTIVPVDGLPERPEPTDADRFAPVIDWLADGEGGASVVFVFERPGPRRLSPSDQAWIRALRRSALLAELPVRAQLLAHDDGVRWLAPDDYV